MSSYFDKSLKAVGLAATLAIVGVSSLACTGPAQGNKVTDGHLTAQQCIDNRTAGSVEPYEEDLVAEGLVNTELNKIPITHGMCEEIIERTPRGSPIARAAVVGNLTQELTTIKKSLEDASGKDVNGDGMVNAEDKETADSASLAAAHAAQTAVRRPTEEEGAQKAPQQPTEEAAEAEAALRELSRGIRRQCSLLVSTYELTPHALLGKKVPTRRPLPPVGNVLRLWA